MVIRDRIYTLEEFIKFYEDAPENVQYELIDGRVIEMSPVLIKHQRIVRNIFGALFIFLQGVSIGEVFGDRTAYAIPGAAHWYEPDVSVVLNERIPADDNTPFFRLAPDLAVEVISKSESPADVVVKTETYLQAGSQVVWQVFAGITRVDGWELRDGQLTRTQQCNLDDTLLGEPVLPGFTLPVKDIFRGIA